MSMDFFHIYVIKQDICLDNQLHKAGSGVFFIFLLGSVNL